MTRAFYLTFYGEYRGAKPPARVGPRIVIPLIILAVAAVVVGFTNLPTGPCRRARVRRPPLRALRRARQRSPSRRPTIGPSSTTRSSRSGSPCSRPWRRPRRPSSSTSGTGGAPGPHGLTYRNRWPAPGYRLLENKYYLDALYTGVIAGGIKGPIARGTNWVNQNIIDGVVNRAGTSARVAAAVRLRERRPGRGRHHRERLGRRRRRHRGSSSARARPARSSIRRLLFGGPPSWPPCSSSSPSASDQERDIDGTRLARRLGARASPTFIPLVGALVMMAHPQGRGDAAQGRRPGHQPGRARDRDPGRSATSTTTTAKHAPVRGRPAVDRRHQQPLHRRHRRHLAAAAAADGVHRPAGDHLLLEPLPRAPQPQGLPDPDPHPRDGHGRHASSPRTSSSSSSSSRSSCSRCTS